MYKTPLMHICITETGPPGCYLGHRPAAQPANTALGSDPTNGLRQRQPAFGLHLRNPLIAHLADPGLRDGWLSWPCWLTDSGRFTHKVVTWPAISLAQVRESSPARTGGLTTMLRNQLIIFRISSAPSSPVSFWFTSSFTNHLISFITTLTIHHSVTLSFHTQHIPLSQILPSIDLPSLPVWLDGYWTILPLLMLISLFCF